MNNSRRTVIIQPQAQAVPLNPVYAGPIYAAPPGGMVPGQPVFSVAGGFPYMQPNSPQQFMQPVLTTPPVHMDRPLSPSSQQQKGGMDASWEAPPPPYS